MNAKTTHLLGRLCVIALLMAACGDAAEPTPVPSSTPTDTPSPTGTPTPLPTATPTATYTATPDIAATTAAEETQVAEAMIEQIDDELQAIGHSTAQGRLGWFSTGPVDLRIASFNTFDIAPLAAGEVFSDFVMKADVTWDSSSGLAICGFWFRSQGTDADAEHYVFQTIRLSGLPSWDVEYWNFNQWRATVSPGGKIISTPHIDQGKGSTNTFIMAAEDNLLTVYANGNRLGQVTISSLREGLIAYYAWQESGDTTCSFDNAWVWDLSQ